ncbi:MAG: 2-amino-4-hydroxy-6-hydroxymethyldihydropteridine diphosphokinase [Gemmatimonadota bacterium]
MSTDDDRHRPVFLSLGSNIEPERHLRRAVGELARAFALDAVSRVYESEPVASPGAPPFLNAAVRLRTPLSPRTLKLEHLRPLEERLGRRRGDDPNAPRTIDLDLSLVGALVLSDPEARIELPDPEILIHAHLARPLADLDPRFPHPLSGETLGQIAARLARDPGVRPRDDVKLVLPRPIRR